MKRYKANKKHFIYIILFFTLFPLLGFYFSEEYKFVNSLLLSIPLLLFLWIYLSTHYKIENNNLFYSSAFLKGKINISEINEIIAGKTLWAGTKSALAKKGLIIKYKFDEIYVAPESNSEMIADLLNLNPNIKISGDF